MLDFTPLQNALDSLKRALDRSQKEPSDEEVRDAVIQRFEYSYELCFKMLKRQLEQESAFTADIDQKPFKELIREAAIKGLLKKPEKWFDYRRARNISSHTYDEDKAQQVYESAVDFYPDAKELLDTLLKRNAT